MKREGLVSKSDLTPTVDFDYLEKVAAGDAALVDEVLKIFGQQAALWARQLEARSLDWRDTLHTMKGAGRSIGATALGDACERAEAEAGDDLAPVREALDRALIEIAAYRRARRA